MSEPGTQSAREFSNDWCAREPTLALAAKFAAHPERWLAAVVLIEELIQAMMALSSITVAHAKLSWWAEEADLTAASAPRHPLTRYLLQEQAPLRELITLIRSALIWLELPIAQDRAAQLEQLRPFAHAAAALADEGEQWQFWRALALKRQIQAHAKADRYGPPILSRAELAEHQLKAAQLADRRLADAALRARFGELADAMHLDQRSARSRSGTRAYAALQAREAKYWAKRGNLPFERLALSPMAAFFAWWHGRG
jgi:hypothetical protein